MKTLLRLTAATLCLSCVAPAYYHFIRFDSRNAPFLPIPQKFDLATLPGKTVTYFVGDTSNVQFASGDSATALLSQIRAAAAVWNSVDSSDLRIAYGGSLSASTPQSAPSIEISFDEVPPGLLAVGGVTASLASNGKFVPIVKSVVRIQPDLVKYPVYSDRLFTTLVHEIGHALGLQHTYTGGVMATFYTRGVTRARPLAADDIAGISVLYPRPGFTDQTGSLSGRVTMGGDGVNLASVVAIAPNGPAVSTLSNPDGTWRIDGLPAGDYYIYVHPLPPPQTGETNPGDIVYPVDGSNRTFPAGAPFETVFYSNGGGVRDTAFANSLTVRAGQWISDLNFAVRQRNGNAINTVETYSFLAGQAIKPAFLTWSMANQFLVAAGNGMFNAAGLVPGLRASLLGGSELAVRPYPYAPTSYAQFSFDDQTLYAPTNSVRHLVLQTNNDMTVLPSAFFHGDRLPPQLTLVAGAMDGNTRLALLSGLRLAEDTRVLFDGVPAQVRSFVDDVLTVVVPNAPVGHSAVVTAINSDGQSSQLLLGAAPLTYSYQGDDAATPSGISITPSVLPAGVESMIQIDAQGLRFAQGQVSISFGTGDIAVNRVWVVSPTRLLANITIAPNASLASLNLTLVSGLQTFTSPGALQIQAASESVTWLASGLGNASAPGSPLTPGATLTLTVGGAQQSLTSAGAVVVLSDWVRMPITPGPSAGQVSFLLPANFPPGLATARLENGLDRSLSIAFQVDAPPPPPAQ